MAGGWRQVVKRENSWSTVRKEEDRREVAKTVGGGGGEGEGEKRERRKKRKQRENFEGKRGKKCNPQIAVFYTINNKNVKAIDRKNGLPRFANVRDQID